LFNKQWTCVEGARLLTKIFIGFGTKSNIMNVVDDMLKDLIDLVENWDFLGLVL
jgi:hypothetical protein